MRQSLIDLFKRTVVFKYCLPHGDVQKSVYSTMDDHCYMCVEDQDLSRIIYNSLIDYAFNENEMQDEDINLLHIEAISQRMRIEENDDEQTQKKYGFFGEVLLNLMLRIYYSTNSIIAKGYFYDILKPEEPKGYDSYHFISYYEKIAMFQDIMALSRNEVESIHRLILYFQRFKNISSEGIETIIKVVSPYVKNNDLKFLMDNGKEGHTNKYLTSLLFTYLSNGFRGMVDYGCEQQGKSIDEAVRYTAKFVYNTLKYQVVKYFGAFNLMYKYHISLKTGASIQEVPGIDALLLRLEYNANTEKGRLASDYGVPQRIIDYYDADNEQAAKKIYNDFDTYEKAIFHNISLIMNN